MITEKEIIIAGGKDYTIFINKVEYGFDAIRLWLDVNHLEFIMIIPLQEYSDNEIEGMIIDEFERLVAEVRKLI